MMTARMRMVLVVSAYRSILTTCQILHRIFPVGASGSIIVAALLTVLAEMTLPQHRPAELHAWLDTAINEWSSDGGRD